MKMYIPGDEHWFPITEEELKGRIELAEAELRWWKDYWTRRNRCTCTPLDPPHSGFTHAYNPDCPVEAHHWPIPADTTPAVPGEHTKGNEDE